MTKAQLRAYRDIKLERDKLDKMIDELEQTIYGPRSPSLSGMPGGKSKPGTPTEDAAVQKFSVHFEMLQAEFETLKNVAADLKREDPDMATKLQAALRSILKTMQEVLV